MDTSANASLVALRKADGDRYLSVLYAPASHREALATLYLFNAEIAATRDRIREALPGEIRIQWWRDTLTSGASATTGHPVADALLAVINEYELPLSAFENYLDARIFDLYDDPMPSRSDLEGYCGETASAIIQLACLILEPEAASAFADACGHAGCSQGIAGIVRLLPLHRSRGQCYIPADILAIAGTCRDEFLSGTNPDATSRAIDAFIALGYEHFGRFEKAAKDMPASLRAAFLPAALARHYFDKASSKDFNPITAIAEISAIRRHWTFLSSAMRGWG